MNQTIASKIANTVQAYFNCIKTGNDYANKHLETLDHIAKEYLPSGSGIDDGCLINIDKTSANKVVITTAFHHMDSNGFYDGWTQHDIIVTPSFNGIDIRITGLNKNDIKDYLADVFYIALPNTL